MKITLLVIILHYFSIAQIFAQTEVNCNELKDSCEFYLCVESQKKCGDKGYFKSFGHNYCYKYENVITNQFSKHGQAWLKDVRECLIEEISNLDKDISCKELNTLAFNSHIPCYKETNFCHLPITDKITLIKSLKKDIKNPALLKAGLRVISSCKFLPSL